MSKQTPLVTKQEALDMLSAYLRQVQPPHVMHKLLNLYAEISGWKQLVANNRKRKQSAKKTPPLVGIKQH